MSKDFKLYEKDDQHLKTKFIRLMDLLVSNKSSSQMESIFLISISFTQLISGFFSEDVGLFSEKSGVPDSYLNMLKNIIRIKDLFKNNFAIYEIVIYLIFITLLLLTILFFHVLNNNKKTSHYSYKEVIINLSLKLYLFILFIPILDLSLAIFCIEAKNPNFENISCNLSERPALAIISILVLIYSISISLILSLFYNDSLFLSNSCLARISCNYEIYHTINIVIFSLLLFLQRYIGTLIFLIYNILISLFFVKFLFEKYPFYNSFTSLLIGTFHTIYAWTSIFGLIFFYMEVKQKSILYVCGILITIVLYRNLQNKLEDDITLRTPFHKISNKYHLLHYIKSLLDKINNVENVIEDKALLIGIIQMHISECPQTDCITKKRDKIDLYLPVTDEWSIRNTPETNDKVFMLNFITIVLNYFMSQNYFSPDTLMNISAYYLIIIGNYCQAMIYNKKVSDMKLSIQEDFSYSRTKILISKALVEKLKPSNEDCFNLEEINTTMYYKYDELSEKFFEEINNDINLNLEFWKVFKTYKEDSTKLDFNQIFSLTDRIRVTKEKIEKLWENLFETYNGFNDIFDLYENYIDHINDDGPTKRELETTKNKIFSQNEHLGVKNNLYNILFNKDTGIIIINGDKGKEGMIEKANENVQQFFGFGEEELKGMNINFLMPKIFEKHHKSYMERYSKIGEKRIIDKNFLTYGKDKKNSLIAVTNRIKLFPMLGDYICFCAMMIKENSEDIVLLDHKFNIQGMSKHLTERFRINENLFSDCDVPFYLICKKFINHYKLFMLKAKDTESMYDFHKSEISNNTNIGVMLKETGNLTNNKINNEKETLQNEEAYQISENAELEFEIKIPELIKNYISLANRKATDIKVMKSNTNNSEEVEEQQNLNTIGVITEKTEEDENYEENSGLIHDNDTLMQDINQSGLNRKNSDSKLTNHKEEDKEFQNKLNYYKNYFEKKQFDSLEKEIERLNVETKEIDHHKFIFTLNSYKYGDNQLAYVVRCIDNKEDTNVNVNSESKEMRMMGQENDPEKDFNNNHLNTNLNYFHRKKYLHTLQKLNDISLEEKDLILEALGDYYKLCKEDSNYYDRLEYHRNEILSSSRIFGFKKSDILIDEASSQSSNASFNDDLSKKAKIEEIKYSMMKNVYKFYTLKVIKFVFYALILLTILFAFLFVVFFDDLFTDALNINQLNTIFYINTFTMSNFISSLVTMRSLYEIVMNKKNINFNTFTDGMSNLLNENNLYSQYEKYEKYFNHLKLVTFDLGDLIKEQNAYIENNFTKFFNNYAVSLYWDKIYAGYSLDNIFESSENKIGYPVALLKSLIQSENLLKSNFFNIPFALENNFYNFSQENLKNYKFTQHYAIENAYDTLIPHQIKLLNEMDSIFSEFNLNNLESVINLIIIYSVLILILCFIYVISLYLTNKNMQEALYKVSRISLEKINEILSRIENFNDKILSKYKQDGKNKEFVRIKSDITNNNLNQNNIEVDSKNNNNENQNDINVSMHRSYLNNSFSEPIKKIEKFSFLENKKFKKLNVLNFSYFQIFFIFSLCVVIILSIYFLSLNMITNANNFFQIKKFIFGDLIVTSTSIISINCVVSECDVKESLFYDNSFDSETKQKIITQIKNYPELDKFYNTRFILNICETLYSIDYSDSNPVNEIGMNFYNDNNGITHKKYNLTELESEKNMCVNNQFIKSANNTQTLMKTIFDSIFNINKEIQIKKKIIENFYPGFNEKINNNDLIDDEYKLNKAYESFYFKEMEYIYYNFIINLPNIFNKVFTISLYYYMIQVREIILILIILFTITMIAFSLYIIYFFIKSLIHLLSISRCILKIIPTYVINNTPELEEWLENKF